MKDEKFVVSGPPYERNVDSSLGQVLLVVLRSHGDDIVQVDAATGEILTASGLLNRAIHVAKWFSKNGIKPGDAVSLSSENRLEFCVIPIACFFAGVTFAPFNYDYTPGEINHVLNLSHPKAVFCSPKTVQRILSCAPNNEFLKNIVAFGKEHVNHRQVTMYEDIIKGVVNTSPDEDFEAAPINPETTVATVLCSSGTTGLPKGVMLSHANMTAYIEILSLVLSEETTIKNDERDVVAGIAPFFHSMGFMTMFLAIVAGCQLIVMERFKPKMFLEVISKYKVTRLVVPPPILLFLTRHPMAKNYDLSSLKDVKCGAAPLGKELEMEAKKSIKTSHIGQTYGMTETVLGVFMNPWAKMKLGSVGVTAPGIKCKIIDEQGNALGPNQEGELCIKGPVVMMGYINDPHSTAQTIDKDNWLHTGDVAYYDQEHYFYIVDRLKELIKYKAYQVAPAELEGILLTHPAVIDAAVVGLPDEEAGELPMAYIVKHPMQNATAEEIESFLAGKVSPQKRLRGGVQFISEIPRNVTGKILRRDLRDKTKELKSKL